MQSVQVNKMADYYGHNAAIYKLLYHEEDTCFYSVSGEGWVVRWSADGSSPDGLLIAHTDTKLFAAAIDPGRQMIIAGDISGSLYWVDIEHKKMAFHSVFHRGSIFDIKIIHDNQLLTVSADGFFCIWNIETRFPVFSQRLSHQGLRCAVISETTNSIFVGASDNNIYEIDSRNWTLKNVIEHAHHNSVFALEMGSIDSLWSGGRDAHLRVRTIPDGQQKHDIAAHWFTINQIKYIPSLELIITASRDKTLRIWDEPSGQLLKTLDQKSGGHMNSVNTIQWIEKFNTLVSAGDDRIIKVWQIART